MSMSMGANDSVDEFLTSVMIPLVIFMFDSIFLNWDRSMPRITLSMSELEEIVI